MNDIHRAIQGQVDDQDVYCRFGLKWSATEDDFVVDSLGCQASVKYGMVMERLLRNSFHWCLKCMKICCKK